MSNKLKGISKNKTGAIIVSILLVLSMSTSMMLFPIAKAQTPGETIPTFAYIAVSTNPVGTGQSVEVIMWLNQVINAAMTANSIRFHNYQLVITEPNGDNQTQAFPIVYDTTSAQDYSFTPTQVGTYTLTFSFPGQIYNFPLAFSFFGSNAAYEGDYYAPSSASITLTVQSTPIAGYPTTPLPTQYWTRPIYGMNSNWAAVSSNWLGSSAPGYGGFASTYNAGGNGEQLAGASDVVGSMTSHIMWTKPLDSGGVVGGNQTSIYGNTYFEGSAYNQRYTNPIIVDGMLYYTEPISFAGVPGNFGGSPYGPTDCVNLQTGQLIWSRSDVPALSFAYVYDVESPNQHGVYPPILFSSAATFGPLGTIWRAFDAYTGDPMFNVTNVPSGTSMLGSNGEELIITLANLGTPTVPSYYLQEWNSSRLWGNNYSGASTSPPVVPPISNGNTPSLYDFNVSVTGVPAGGVTQVGAILDDRLLCYAGNLPSTGAIFMGSQSDTPYTYFALSISQSHSSSLGSILWHQTYNPPQNNITVLEAGIDPVNRVFVENWRETSQYVGYSLDTGQKIWGPTVAQAYLDYYGSPASGSLANAFGYGKMYSSAYAGIVYCYDTKTGNLLWTYGNGGEGNNTNSGVETPFGHYPTFVNAIGSGVVYLVTTEHTPETPLFKGAVATALNATTGKVIWTLSEYTGEFEVFSYAAADGYNTWFNGYDAQIYTVGRGPSQLTVTAPNAGLASGQPVVIRGTVTDVSAGTKENEQASNFPNGVPVCSDASMREWMGYVYQQQQMPTNFTGVPVQIYVFDSNHNYRPIGTATTNANGMYTLTWTPDIAGNYTVYAAFAGTLGYWPSTDSTSFTVMQAGPTAAPTATPLSGVSSENTLVYGIAAIIVVIVIIGAVLALLVTRKHP